jgi:hypothetical protein
VEKPGYTPSDFPLAQPSQSELDRILTAQPELRDIYPLTPMQEGLLFHTLYSPEDGTYFDQLTCELRGELDRDAFSRAWQTVMQRHAVLRTAFVWENLDRPRQVVVAGVELPLTLLDWRDQSAAERDQRLETLLAEDMAAGFNLEQAPLFRLILIATAENRHRLIWSTHHLLLDGWSWALLLAEVFTCYGAHQAGRQPQLPPRGQYRDYLAWLGRQDPRRAETFWRQYLSGLHAGGGLGLPGPRTPDTTDYHIHSHLLSEKRTRALEAAATSLGVTLNNLVQAAWALILRHYGAGDDVVFGTTVSGRPAELDGYASMVGLLINTVPVRVRLNAEEPLNDLLVRLQSQGAAAQPFAYTPLPQILKWRESHTESALFETLLVFENYPIENREDEASGLEIADVRKHDRANYPLTLVVQPGRRLDLVFFFETHRFEKAAVTRLAAQMDTLLGEMAAHPRAPLQQLSLTSAAERRAALAAAKPKGELSADMKRLLASVVRQKGESS